MKSAVAALRAGFSLVAPGGLLLLAAVLLLRSDRAASWSTLFDAYPYVALLAGLGLGLRFGQSRLTLAVVLLAAANAALAAYPDRRFFNAVAVLLPLDLAVLGLLSERGLLTLRGFLRVGFLIGQAPLIYIATTRSPPPRWVLLSQQDLVGHQWTAWTHLPQPALAVMAFAALVLALRFLVIRGPLDGGFFWALMGSSMALHVHADAIAATTYFATAQLVLCAAVIERSHAMAYRDELTGLPGRRALNERLDQLGGRYAIAMVDVDHFKRFNDRYGHDTGDHVLRLIASHLRQVTGDGAAFRYGGEEFAVVFRRKDIGAAKPHLERLRQAIAESRFTLRSSDRPKRKPKTVQRGSARADVRITVSIGVADAASGRTADDVIRAADRGLYRAKNGGRNCLRAS